MVYDEETYEEKLLNAKYAISMAKNWRQIVRAASGPGRGKGQDGTN